MRAGTTVPLDYLVWVYHNVRWSHHPQEMAYEEVARRIELLGLKEKRVLFSELAREYRGRCEFRARLMRREIWNTA